MQFIYIKKIDKLLNITFLKTFFATFLSTIAIIILASTYTLLNFLYDKDLPIILCVKVIFKLCITLISYILIISTITSTMLFTVKMDNKLELCALKTVGIGFNRFVFHLLKSLFIIIIISFAATHYFVPHASKETVNITKKILQSNPAFIIKEKVFITTFNNICFYAERKINDNELENVLIYKTEQDKKITTTAKYAKIIKNDGHTLQIVMKNGNNYIETFNTNGKNVNSVRVSFEEQKILIDIYDFFDFNPTINSLLLEDSFVLYNFIRKKKKELDVTINNLWGNIKKHEDNDCFRNDFYSFIGGTKEESSPNFKDKKDIEIFIKEHCFPKEQNILPQFLKICSKIKKEKNFFKQSISKHKKILMTRNNNVLICIIFFLLGLSIGFLLKRGRLIMSIFVSTILSIFYFCIMIYLQIIVVDKNINIYISAFGPSFPFILLLFFYFYHAHKDSHVSCRRLYVLFLKQKHFVVTLIKNIYYFIKKQ